jgi:hypothetical protein
MEDIKFGIPFYTYSIPDWETKKKIILNSLPNFKQYKLEKSKTSGHGDKNHYTDYFDNLEKPPEYAKTVIECLDDQILEFCRSTNDNWNLTSIWFQTYEKYNNFSVHNHGIEGWSAILYVEFDSLEHSPTTFYSPHLSWEKKTLGQYNSNIPNVKEGDLIIFPAMIQHEASSNMSDKTRTIISFNLK